MPLCLSGASSSAHHTFLACGEPAAACLLQCHVKSMIHVHSTMLSACRDPLAAGSLTWVRVAPHRAVQERALSRGCHRQGFNAATPIEALAAELHCIASTVAVTAGLHAAGADPDAMLLGVCSFQQLGSARLRSIQGPLEPILMCGLLTLPAAVAQGWAHNAVMAFSNVLWGGGGGGSQIELSTQGRHVSRQAMQMLQLGPQDSRAGWYGQGGLECHSAGFSCVDRCPIRVPSA